ncbi:ABC transporter ATP-binding protein [Aureimonas mangrovi]|uniref:ABC transporter ATP-binding protein n=1 Tax=Aureimonas mangrovi TaxID=2758041 RepID=UPI00163DDC53|nr:ABC transporter ATP-binding protein [Aureimonas mangrovi]
MTAPVLDVRGIGKRYTTYATNLQRFANWFGARLRPESEFWAVEDISFSVAPGESIALIGQNGAGKSTLLKLVTGTVRPSRGSIGIAGRVSALLELGLGFNPEFTGRENVYQAGGMMGFSQDELTAMMPAIEDFAEIGAFFEQPLRVYSSGMQARLAFALATARRPDILIVDEILSVGDSYFQHKSFERIRRFRAEGTSIILVSHAMSDVRALCDRVILLDKGRVLKDGPPDEVVDYYNALVTAKENEKLTVEQRRQKDGWLYSKSGSGEARIVTTELVDAATLAPLKTAQTGQDLVLRVSVEVSKAIPELVLGFMIRDRTGHVVFGTNTWHTRQTVKALEAGEHILYDLRFPCSLGQGSYGISLALHASDVHVESNFAWIDNVEVFDVINGSEPFFIGSTRLDLRFAVSR